MRVARVGAHTKSGRADRGGAGRNDNFARADSGEGRGAGRSGGTSMRRPAPAQLASFGDDFFTDGGLDADDESAQVAITHGFAAALEARDIDADNEWTQVTRRSSRGFPIVEHVAIATPLITDTPAPATEWTPVTPPTTDNEDSDDHSHLLAVDMVMPGDTFPYDGTVDYGFSEAEIETEPNPDQSEHDTAVTESALSTDTIIFGNICLVLFNKRWSGEWRGG